MGPVRRRPHVWIPPIVALAAITGFAPSSGTVLELRADGVGVWPPAVVGPVPPHSSIELVPATNVVTTADRTAPAVVARIAADRAWLASGAVPGRGTPFGPMAQRALLDLRALTMPNGAVLAAPVTMWKHVWPRDAAFVAATFALTGHADDAARVLGFLAEVAPADGRWEARYRPDGSGPPDDRPSQLDGSGWMLWAAWIFAAAVPDDAMVARVLQRWRPALIASAEAIVAALGPDGLPEPSADYWELPETRVTLGTAAPLSVGLRAAVDLGPALGVDTARWAAASRRLDRAIADTFGAHGYPRTVPRGGADAAVAFVAPPFAPVSERVRTAVLATEEALRVDNGGHRPGQAWRKDVNVAWTPETALLAMAAAGVGADERARELLEFLDVHRTALGSLPEKVDARGRPASVAPLSWTAASVLLTLIELESGLPVVPPA